MHALEAMFVIRRLSTEGTEMKTALYFEDQVEATYLSSNRYDERTQLERLILQLEVFLRFTPIQNLFLFTEKKGTRL